MLEEVFMVEDDSWFIFDSSLEWLYDFMHEKWGFGDAKKYTCTDPNLGIKLYLFTKLKIMKNFGKVYKSSFLGILIINFGPKMRAKWIFFQDGTILIGNWLGQKTLVFEIVLVIIATTHKRKVVRDWKCFPDWAYRP